jgi:SAM-dependent methyltransferase
MPTNWESRYAAADTPWEKGSAHPALVEYLKMHRISGRILVPGCGSGHDVRALAAQGAAAIGLDIAPGALARAEAYPKAGAESYLQGNLFALPADLIGAFDAAWEHTCFCAIDPAQRSDYVTAVHSALKSGGQLFAIFYLDPGNNSPDEGPPFEVSVSELDRLFLPHFELVEEWLPQQTYPGREGREWMRVMRRK